MDMAQRLRAGIADLHLRIEQLPLAQALANGRVAHAQYLSLLEQLLFVHEVHERQLREQASLAWLWQPHLERVPALRRDLDVLGGSSFADPLPEAQQLAQLFEQWGAQAPATLIGSVHVFEGSRMGSMVLAPALAHALGVRLHAGCGLDYHLEGQAERGQRWQRYKTLLTEAPLSAAEQAQAEQGAVATMQGLFHLYAALDAPTATCCPPTVSSAADAKTLSVGGAVS